MKYLVSVLFLLFIAITSFSEIKEFDPTKVLVDVDTGMVIFVPREIDYKYGIDLKTLKVDHRPSLKELILGKRGCGG